MKKSIIILIILIGIYSCAEKTEQPDVQTIKITKEIPVKASGIFQDFSFIKLETSDSCVLAPLKNIEMYSDKIYITDIVFEGIYIFDRKGNLLETFDRLGKGPGEYSNIDDFLIDEQQQTIEILDGNKKKIFIYNLTDLHFIKTIEVPILFSFTFSKLRDTYYFQTNTAQNHVNNEITNSEIISFNPKTGVVKALFEKVLPKKENRHWEFFDIFIENEGKDLYASLAWHEKVYKLDNGIAHVFAKIDKSDRGIPQDIIASNYENKMQYLESNAMDNKLHFFHLVMNKEKLCLMVYGKSYPPDVCYYIQFNKDSAFCTNNIINDFIPVKHEHIEFFKEEKGQLLTVIYPFEEEDNKELLNHFDATTEDNPIILTFKLK